MNESTVQPTRVSARTALHQAGEGFFGDLSDGHFWLEHLVRALADSYATRSTAWDIYMVSTGGERVGALYAVNTFTGYGMLHAVAGPYGATLLAWALQKHPPHKILGNYFVLEHAIRAANLTAKIRRDHREIFLHLPLGALSVTPDWAYRLATEEDIPRLKEYNDLYNRERQTRWSRNWSQAITERLVYVRERAGTVSSCLLKGALLPPRISFGGVFTFPEFRGMGEATMLVADFCAEMALSGLDVCLIVDDDNGAALRAYTKVGFTPAGLYRTTYFD